MAKFKVLVTDVLLGKKPVYLVNQSGWKQVF